MISFSYVLDIKVSDVLNNDFNKIKRTLVTKHENNAMSIKNHVQNLHQRKMHHVSRVKSQNYVFLYSEICWVLE